MKTPRQLAAEHLPELADSFDLMRRTFEAELVWFQTPVGAIGTAPGWFGQCVPLSPPSDQFVRGRR